LLSLAKTKTVSHSWASNKLLFVFHSMSAAGDCPTAHRGCPVGCCSMRLLPSALWESNRLVGCCFIKLERCLSTAGGYRTVLPLPCCCLLFGSRVRHVVSSALRGPFSIVGMLPALRGLFFLVDMLRTLSGLFSVVDMLPGSPLSGHLPFVAFLVSVPLSLSLVVFLLCELSRLGRWSVRSLTVATSLPVRSLTSDPLQIQFLFLFVDLENPLLW
jgi:hypothetical protein